jgi:hypothetical protein
VVPFQGQTYFPLLAVFPVHFLRLGTPVTQPYQPQPHRHNGTKGLAALLVLVASASLLRPYPFASLLFFSASCPQTSTPNRCCIAGESRVPTEIPWHVRGVIHYKTQLGLFPSMLFHSPHSHRRESSTGVQLSQGIHVTGVHLRQACSPHRAYIS